MKTLFLLFFLSFTAGAKAQVLPLPDAFFASIVASASHNLQNAHHNVKSALTLIQNFKAISHGNLSPKRKAQELIKLIEMARTFNQKQIHRLPRSAQVLVPGFIDDSLHELKMLVLDYELKSLKGRAIEASADLNEALARVQTYEKWISKTERLLQKVAL